METAEIFSRTTTKTKVNVPTDLTDMEVPFDFSTAFTSNLVRLDNADLKRLNPRNYPAFEKALDGIGKLSSEAQGLRHGRLLTSYQKTLDSEEPMPIYICWEPSPKPGTSILVGFLKVARRVLYLYDSHIQQIRMKPLCILDFYVHHSRQRQGEGHRLYDHMLQTEGVPAHGVAIDRPSESLIAFMTKHYGLKDPQWQNNHFVIYPGFHEFIRGESYDTVDSMKSPVGQRGRNGVNGTPREYEDTATIMQRNARHVPPPPETWGGPGGVPYRSYPTPSRPSTPSRPATADSEALGSPSSRPGPDTGAAEFARQQKVKSLGHSNIW